MEQNQTLCIESMLKCCDVKRGGKGGNNDVNFSTRTLDKLKAPKAEVPNNNYRLHLHSSS